MAKFINKKEQVFDLRLTSYGRYLMSIGKFKPAFYSFYDDNILYDKKYAHSTATENQNDINSRIKDDTQYLESLVLFRDVDSTLSNSNASYDSYDQTVTQRQRIPAKDVFMSDLPLGDAMIEGSTNKAPAWKVVNLQSVIDTIEENDSENNSIIPQINMSATYIKKVFDGLASTENNITSAEESIRYNLTRTSLLEDGKGIMLKTNDPICYIEEVNTQLLINNFEMEIFEVKTSSNAGSYEQLERKYFRSKIPQVQNGFLVSEKPESIPEQDLTTDDVEYYFDVLIDSEIDQTTACKAANFFNKKSYYVDLDFECEETDEENIFYDIYGTVTEPEVCLD